MDKIITAPPQTLAQELYEIQENMRVLAEYEKDIKSKLLASLVKQKVQSVKLEDGTMYIRSHRQSLKIKDQEKAEKWAEDTGCWKLDTGKILKVIRKDLKIPPFFKIENGAEYLTIKKPGQPDDEE